MQRHFSDSINIQYMIFEGLLRVRLYCLVMEQWIYQEKIPAIMEFIFLWDISIYDSDDDGDDDDTYDDDEVSVLYFREKC